MPSVGGDGMLRVVASTEARIARFRSGAMDFERIAHLETRFPLRACHIGSRSRQTDARSDRCESTGAPRA